MATTDKSIYKQLPLADAQNRTIKPLNSVKKAKVNTIVTNFITYLKAAHS
jgi:hypothetical protein